MSQTYCLGKQNIYWIGFVLGFGFYRRQISKRSTSGYRTFRALVEYSFDILRSSARTINIKTGKKSWLTSCQHHELHCLADVIFYRRLIVFLCYLSAIMHELNNSLCNWFPPLHNMCILRSFRHHYNQFVIWNPMRVILRKRYKASKTEKKEEKKKQLGQIQTQYAKNLYSK